jgi:dsDNA-specific endonuclease/ATPase MutS2
MADSLSSPALYRITDLLAGDNKQLINALSIKDLEGRRRMSEEKRNVERLVQRIDELLMVLNQVAEDLRQVSISLKSIAVSQLPQPLATPPTPAPAMSKAPERMQAIEDIKMMFPEDLENLLSFEEKEDYIIVKPRQFLGSENFAKIASVVRGIGGDYVSAGKASHFRVPKKRA